MKYEYNFPMASLAVDIIVFCPYAKNVLLIKRRDEPYKGCYALPGGFVEIDSETFQEAAKRELQEETNLNLPLDRFEFEGMLDNPKRDTRGRVVSAVFTCQLNDDEVYYPVAGDDAASVEWINYGDILNNRIPLAFDHMLAFDKL